MLFLAAVWYLIVTTVLSIGQYYLERYYARGSSRVRCPADAHGRSVRRLNMLRRG